MLEKIKRIDPWYTLFWVGILTMLSWALLKSFGFINTPVWVEMIPFISGIAATIGIAKYIVRHLLKIEIMDLRLKNVEEKLKDHDKSFIMIDESFTKIDKKFIKLQHKLGI